MPHSACPVSWKLSCNAFFSHGFWWLIRTFSWIGGHGTLQVKTHDALSCVDAYNSGAAAGGNQAPSQMLGMGMPGRGGAIGPEGTPLMPDNGVMVKYSCTYLLCKTSYFMQFVLYVSGWLWQLSVRLVCVCVCVHLVPNCFQQKSTCKKVPYPFYFFFFFKIKQFSLQWKWCKSTVRVLDTSKWLQLNVHLKYNNRQISPE